MDEAKDKKKAPVVKEPVEAPEAIVETLSFDQWFSLKLRELAKLKAVHRDSILAFFKNHNLSEQERKADYDAALKLYGF